MPNPLKLAQKAQKYIKLCHNHKTKSLSFFSGPTETTLATHQAIRDLTLLHMSGTLAQSEGRWLVTKCQ